jgi:hypothetical protein
MLSTVKDDYVHLNEQKPTLVCVPPADVPRAMPLAADMLRSAMTRTQLGSFDALSANLITGRALLWLAWDGTQVVAAAATELAECDGSLVCTLTACGGRNPTGWIPLLRQIEVYAKAEGCRSLRFFGRRGWLRLLPRYRQVAIVAEVAL